MKLVLAVAASISVTACLIGSGYQDRPKAPRYTATSAADIQKGLAASAKTPPTLLWKLSSTLSPALMRQGPYSLSFVAPDSIWAGEIAVMQGFSNSQSKRQSTVIVEMDGLQIGKKYGVVFDLGTYLPQDPIEWDVAVNDVWAKRPGKVPGVVFVTFTADNALSDTVKLRMASAGTFNLRSVKIFRT